jgi:hypothetical protein
MAPKAAEPEGGIPTETKLVVCPFEKPDGECYFNWKDPKFIEWKENAIQMQEAHVKDNSRTKWFHYGSIEDYDLLDKRILMIIYGIRTPKVVDIYFS